MNEIPKFVAMRLNSIIKQVNELEQSKKTPTFEEVEVVWKAYSELHHSILDNMTSQLDEYFPKYRVHNVQQSDTLLQLTKTRVREIADHFLLKLDIDQSNSFPTTLVTQNQIVSQNNVQTLSNLIENVNSLQIPDSNKEQIVALVNEFEEESKGRKEPAKLRKIFFNVAELSMDAASFLLKHASEIGILKDVLL